MSDKSRRADAPAANGGAAQFAATFAEALEHHRAGRVNEALALYRRILEADPQHVDALHMTGEIALRAGRPDLAIEMVGKALEIHGDASIFLVTYGAALDAQGKLVEAVAVYDRALALDPKCAAAHCNLGSTLRELGRPADAVASCRRAIALLPDFPEAYSNLGAALHALGEPAEAVDAYRRALALKPDYVEALSNLGYALQELKQFDDAIACYARALTLRPNLAAVYVNLGGALQQKGQLQEAVEAYRHALAFAPGAAEANSNLGNALRDLGLLDEAIDAYRRALAAKPDYVKAHSNLLFCLNYAPDLPAEAIFAEYRRWNERHAKPLAPAEPRYAVARDPERRLRVGYVSPDLRRHSARHFIEPLFERHDRSAVEVFAYAELMREDDVSARLKGWTDHWLRTAGMSDDALAERIRDDGIDILVDFAGHTNGNRLLVFARRPAPVQVSWLGYGYSTGLEAIDYFLADARFAPPGSESLFSERLARLPALSAYRPAEDMGAPAPRRDPAQPITFGSLTRSVRVNHRVTRAWAEILKATPGSRLVLNSLNFRSPALQRELADRFNSLGVEDERLAMGYDTPPWDVLRGFDVSLDCFPHNSGTTLYESLYLGVPFVTLAGRPSVGRLGAAILTAAGHPEWIASSEAEYIEKAAGLAADTRRLAEIKAALRDEIRASPLMDEVGFTRAVEASYRAMWRRWCAGLAASDLTIAP